jgi:hypothetical protein
VLGGAAWRRWSAAERALVAIAVLAALAGVVEAAVRAAHAGWTPVADNAAIALRTQDVFSAHPPLVGMPSTLGAYAHGHPASHLGPLEFFALAPAYALFGRAPLGLLVGAALVNTAAVLAIAWSSVRLGGARLAAFAMAMLAFLEGALGPLIAEVWNPDIALLPFAAFVALSVVVAAGGFGAMPLALVFGSFALQAHLSYLGLAGLGLLWAAVIAVVRAVVAVRATRDAGAEERARAQRSVHRTALLAVPALAVCWWAPVFQQFTGDRPNLTAVLDGFTAKSTHAGPGFAIEWVGRVIGAPPPFGMRSTAKLALAARHATPARVLVFAIPWVLLGAGIVLAWRRRAWHALGAFATGVVTLVAATVTALRAPTGDGMLFTYNVRWLWPAAYAVWFAFAAGCVALLRAYRSSSGGTARGRVGVTAAWCAVAVLIACWPRAGVALNDEASMRLTRRLVSPTVDALEPGGAYVVRGRGPVGSVMVAPGLAVALERHGIHAYIGVARKPPISPWGEHRIYDDQRVDGTLWVVSGEEKPPTASARRIARRSAATDEMRRDAAERRTAVLAFLHEHGVRPTAAGARLLRHPAGAPHTAAQLELARRDIDSALDDGSLASLVGKGLVALADRPRRDLERYTALKDLVSAQWDATVWLDAPPA